MKSESFWKTKSQKTDLERFRAYPHHLKAFDEVTDFSEEMYRFLVGWVRTTDRNQIVISEDFNNRV